MDKQYSFKNEDKMYSFWESGGFFNPDRMASGQKKGVFSIVIPPPNVTGSLHVGHALNATIQDTIIRWKRMQGFKTVWVPGTDHAGIATQNVVEKKLKKEGRSRVDLGRQAFLEEVWEWKQEYGDIILSQLKKLGCSCDWSRTRFTMDADYTVAVQKAFLHYFEKGWIYRGRRVVNWCPRCQTSLSDLEVEYEERDGSLWYIKYPLAAGKNQFIVVATTRPETMLGDTAVAVNPDDPRYRKFIRQEVILPLTDRKIPIISDIAIVMEFGTGAVKVTPAHDLTDYQIGQKNNLPLIEVIDEKGKISSDMPELYRGLATTDARKKIVEDLERLKLIEKVEDYKNQIPKCYRCNSTIELIPSQQWFLEMKELAKIAAKPVENDEIKFHPSRWKSIYLDWIKNANDWCISRQIWWGHRLPVWFCSKERDKYFVSLDEPKTCQICSDCKPEQSEDVFDTWFSSALWPFAVFGWPQETEDLSRFYPTDVLSTARDIINLWAARMIFSGLELVKKVPFRDVIIHATVLTRDGKRMSKSLGTGIDPLGLVEKFGADATRFGLLWQASESQDMRFGENDILAGRKFCNKIWNASRFVLQMTEGLKVENVEAPEYLTDNDRAILDTLQEITTKVDSALTEFRFDQAIQSLYHFFWHQFCDKYIEEAKKQIQNPKTSENTKQILVYVLLTSLKLIHPFMPFVTEEIYQKISGRSKKALIIENWPN
ncbi:MAG: valine--tRNA ligase [Candidatus Portnoybacteria bacterium CG_4_8_14_3_um_filter_40_10]|uniref:Valine--tRNA ligase n=2 Tax=Candidatus Portnoyibacteriota TaxID=1817913 RepID=A0A2M7IIZ9_9BACT|nr:MAG: valine--tRNA ligase [Candidatus Portnoybacteria bacterium CG11_big_fil_rev_8_21_14_0_20_40_15]PIS31903.1 MAG: valine--tRNA ligase [Candidatus Portnoybacteria bacterium CG08_land_8_20_14_0_20_40_83]PIW76494.1 MAG: valine--tRNA ligase [Candidatus Portnoybacteria bacterium CG_4_8_14_3_um_filter_40_10]